MVIWPTPSINHVVNPGPPPNNIRKIFINICMLFVTCWYNYILIQKFVILQLKLRIHSIIFWSDAKYISVQVTTWSFRNPSPPPRGLSWSFHQPPLPPWLTTWYMDDPFDQFDQLEGLRVGPIFTIFGQLLAKNMLNAKIVQNYLIPIQNNLKQRQFLMFWLQKTRKLRISDVSWFPQLILLKNGLKIQSNIEWDTEIIHIHTLYIWDWRIKYICMTRFQLL